MNLFLYIIIFIMGSFFGSFFTLAVYRIPRKEDILVKHSYCPNCNHKLGTLDLFPIFSYIFLKGKCRYCKTKIRPRYFILEILSGITFILIALSLKVNIYSINIVNVFSYFIYVAVLFIIAGIDKEYIKIEDGPLIFGYIFEFTYIIYECTLNKIDVYKYVICLIILIILIIVSIIGLKTEKKKPYYVQVLFLSIYMIIYTGGNIYTLSVILTFIMIALYYVKTREKTSLPIGFYLSISNIVIMIINNLICNYLI